MKKLLFILLLFPLFSISQNSWFNSYPQEGGSLPTIVLNSITNTGGGYCSYLWTGNATADNGSAITKKGFVWNQTGSPTLSDTEWILSSSGLGSYSYSIPSFNANTTYYGRAYATNAFGTAYSNEISFTTANMPSVSTAINYTCNTVMDFIYTVNNLYSQNIITRTFSYGINSSSENFIDAGSGNGSYTWHVTGLAANTTYKYSWQILTNNCDVVNINSTFTTPNFSAPTVTTDQYANVTNTTAGLYGTITSSGGQTPSQNGFVYATTANPTLSNSVVYSTTHSGSFNETVSGLTAGTTYHFRTFATNCVATSYGNDMSFTTNADCVLPSFIAASCGNVTGYSIDATATISSDGGCTITSRGFQYSTDASFNTVLGSVTASGTGIGQYYATITGLTCNTQYYFRPWATNSAGTYYATSLIGSGCMTSNSIPAIQTLTASNITSTSFTLSADPIQAGCPAYRTYSSIMMDTSSSFTNYCRIDSPTPNSLNSFSVTFSGTQCNAISIQSNTTYYWRGVIVSNGNTYYGETKTVTTLP